MQQEWYFQHFSVQIAFLWEFPQEKPQSKNAVIVRISICSLAQLKQVIQCYSLLHFYARLLQGFNRQITLKIIKLICHKMSQDDTSKGTVSFWIVVIYKMCKLTFASKMQLMFLCPSCRKKKKTYRQHFSFFITDTHYHFHIPLSCFIVLIKISIQQCNIYVISYIS